MNRFGMFALTATVALVTASLPVGAHASPERPDRRSGFGSAVVLEDGVAYVGRPGEYALFPIPSSQPGAVHLFAPAEDGGWSETGAVRASDGTVGDAFGTALAVSGDRMIVGAPGAGAAYLFSRESDAWTEVLRIGPPEGDAADGFGSAVALVGDRIAVGAPGADGGAGVVFVYDAAGMEVERLSGGAGDRAFGSSLESRDARLLVGAPGPAADLLGFGGRPDYAPGSAHLYEVTPGGVAPVARLAVADSAVGGLGAALVLLEGEAFVSAPLFEQGAGIIRRFAPGPDGRWGHVDDLELADVPQGVGLGMSMAGDGSTVLVGVPFMGVTIVVERGENGTWAETQRIQGQGPNTFYGTGLAVEGDRALVGAPGEDLFSGAGHVLARAEGGTWSDVAPLTDDPAGLPAIVGEEVVRCAEGEAMGFGCQDVDLVAFLPVSALGAGRGVMVNDVWGWTDPETGREYALVGRSDAMTFVDLGDPSAPVFLGELPMTEGASVNLWRDVKVYGNHAFIVADGAGRHGIQIFDLRQLRHVSAPPVVFEETAHYDRIASAHNIVINEETGFAYVVGASSGGTTCGGGLHMVDVREPTNPTFAGCFQDPATGLAGTGYSHDAQCVVYRGPDPEHHGKEICLGANENALSIADVTDKKAPVAIASATYPNSAYFHQGWLSEDHRFFFANDEGDEVGGIVDRTRTLVWDVEDLDDPILVTEHLGTSAASDHNLYVRGDLMYQSNYLSGLRILDVSDPVNPIEVAFFDTVPFGANAAGFGGSWSNYPFFGSGMIVVTSMREGMFVLRKRERATVF